LTGLSSGAHVRERLFLNFNSHDSRE